MHVLAQNLPKGRNASINPQHTGTNSPKTDSIVVALILVVLILAHRFNCARSLFADHLSPTAFCLSPSMVVQCSSHPLLQARAPSVSTGIRPAFTSTTLPQRRQRLSLVRILAQDKGRTCSSSIFDALTTCLQNNIFLCVFGLPTFHAGLQTEDHLMKELPRSKSC